MEGGTMRNVAKINLEINRCVECPYCNKPEGCSECFCAHDLKHPGLELGDGETIPDFCPFVLERLRGVLAVIDNCSCGSIPKKYLNQIEKRQRDDPHPKFGADHSFGHAQSVTRIGIKFLESCVPYGFTTPNTIQKEILLFKIAAYMHDIGLADSAHNHAIHSAELTKAFFAKNPKIDIDMEDAYTIVHAISNHSDGAETRTMTDAALILADKLDVTSQRIVRVTDKITEAVTHIVSTKYELYGEKKKGQMKAIGARLIYKTDGNFDVSAIKIWPKSIRIPQMITKDFLGLSEFHFVLDEEEIDIETVLK
jgi:hypothetical protein